MLLVSLAFADTLWSTALEDLDPLFRARVERVIDDLTARGFTPVISTTWRSNQLQDLLALGPATNATGGQSCHNRLAGGGRAARAVDIWSAPVDLALLVGTAARVASEVPFLRALGAAGEREALRWGGRWRGRNSVWSAHDLGWDPAHLEVRGCLGSDLGN